MPKRQSKTNRPAAIRSNGLVLPRSDVKRSILKAYEAAKRCTDACAEADAMVATYWKSDGVSIAPNHWDTRHLRDAASLVHSLAHAMLMKTARVSQRHNAEVSASAREKSKP